MQAHDQVTPCGEVAELVDRVALEMRSTGDRTGGSNPSLSANCSDHRHLSKAATLMKSGHSYPI